MNPFFKLFNLVFDANYIVIPSVSSENAKAVADKLREVVAQAQNADLSAQFESAVANVSKSVGIPSSAPVDSLLGSSLGGSPSLKIDSPSLSSSR